MATLTVYPDPGNPGTTSMQALFDYNAGEAVWATARGAANATSTVQGVTDNYIAHAGKAGGFYLLDRTAYLFDTSALTASASVSAAVFTLTASNNIFSDVDTTTLDVVGSTPASNTVGANSDYPNFGTTVFGTMNLSAWTNTDGTANNITLTDLSPISKTSITKLGARLGRDTANNAPTGENYVAGYGADTAGTTKDPKLVITYTLIASGGFLAFM